MLLRQTKFRTVFCRRGGKDIGAILERCSSAWKCAQRASCGMLPSLAVDTLIGMGHAAVQPVQTLQLLRSNHRPRTNSAIAVHFVRKQCPLLEKQMKTTIRPANNTLSGGYSATKSARLPAEWLASECAPQTVVAGKMERSWTRCLALCRRFCRVLPREWQQLDQSIATNKLACSGDAFLDQSFQSSTAAKKRHVR